MHDTARLPADGTASLVPAPWVTNSIKPGIFAEGGDGGLGGFGGDGGIAGGCGDRGGFGGGGKGGDGE